MHMASDVRRRRHAGARAPYPQRTTDDDSDAKKTHRRGANSEQKAHSKTVPHALGLALGVVAFYALALGFAAHSHAWLPPPLSVDAPRELFSEARARVVLANIMSVGYHPVGSRANEELIPAYLVAEVRSVPSTHSSFLVSASGERVCEVC